MKGLLCTGAFEEFALRLTDNTTRLVNWEFFPKGEIVFRGLLERVLECRGGMEIEVKGRQKKVEREGRWASCHVVKKRKDRAV